MNCYPFTLNVAVVTYTCSDLNSLGPAAKTLTPTEIGQIEPDEFYDCLSTLGDVEGWSSEQGTALLEALKVVIYLATFIYYPSPRTLLLFQEYNVIYICIFFSFKKY